MAKLPTGARIGNLAEMDCREGKHKASEISEAAYRRGFQHGVHLLLTMMEEYPEWEEPICRLVRRLAYEMRYDAKRHRSYLHEMQLRVMKKLKLPEPV